MCIMCNTDVAVHRLHHNVRTCDTVSSSITHLPSSSHTPVTPSPYSLNISSVVALCATPSICHSHIVQPSILRHNTWRHRCTGSGPSVSYRVTRVTLVRLTTIISFDSISACGYDRQTQTDSALVAR